MRRVAFVGSRSWSNVAAVRKELKRFSVKDTLIVSGGARGADKIAQNEATRLGFVVAVLYPPWQAAGRGAGLFRNRFIVDLADEVIAFWNGESRGTLDTISQARILKKEVKVIREEN